MEKTAVKADLLNLNSIFMNLLIYKVGAEWSILLAAVIYLLYFYILPLPNNRAPDTFFYSSSDYAREN